MVYYEVNGLYRNFDELVEMEKNGWQALPPSPKKKKLQVIFLPWAHVLLTKQNYIRGTDRLSCYNSCTTLSGPKNWSSNRRLKCMIQGFASLVGKMQV